MYLSILLSSLLIISVIVVASISYLQHQQSENSRKYYVEKAASVASQVDTVMAELESVAIQLQSSAALQKMFVAASSEEYQGENYFVYNIEARREASDIIWMFAAARPHIAGIHIFGDSSYVGMRDIPKTEYIHALAEETLWNLPENRVSKYVGYHVDRWDTMTQREVVSVVRAFEATNYKFINIGTIEVQVKYETIEAICKENLSETMEVVILADDGDVIYPKEGISEEQRKQINRIITTKPECVMEPVEWDGVKQILTVTPIGNTGWNAVVLDEQSVLGQSRWDVIRLTILFTLPIMLLILLCMIVATRGMVRHIVRLSGEVEQLTPGQEEIHFTPTGIKELATLQEAFANLLRAANEATKELLLAQQVELGLRMNALQAQTDPHYLFNSLSAISAVGIEENSERIPVMCHQLGELFRYASTENANTTLADELQHISLYIDFMKWRYEDKLHSEIHLSGPLEEIPITRVSLQPLVENCFTHGFKGAFAPYYLNISCECSEAGWHFFIRDNGCGFDRKTVEKISSEISKIDTVLENHEGYEKLKSQDSAILNLYIRLKLQYGDALRFEILRDKELGGALVKIVVEW